MSSVVAEKQFVWRFVDKVTQGVKQARQSMDEAANSVKQSGTGVKNAGTDWKEMGVDAKNAAQEASQSIDEMKEKILSYQHAGADAMRTIRDQLDLYEKQLNGVPKEKLTNLKAKVDDSALKAHERMIHDVPPEKGTRLYIKDAFSNQLKNFKNKFHDAASSAQRDADNTKRSFSTLKGVMAGTFVGGAVLNGIYAIGNGLKEAAGAGMQFDTEQQKMNQTWLTLTGNASKGRAMVNTINDLSVKTGQSRDLVNELEQGFYHLHSRKSEADDMTKSMLNMGDAVGLTSEQMQQVEQDMVHGLATGKVTQGELNQIGMYFPMIDEAMAKHFHTTVAGMRRMASAGKISGKDLEEVFEQLGSGKYNKAADNMMKSMWGMERTIRSQTPALIGAFEKPFFNAKNPFYEAVSKWMLDPATQKGFENAGKTMANAFNGAISAVADLIRPFRGLNQVIGGFVKSLAGGVLHGIALDFRPIGDAVQFVLKMIDMLLSPINMLTKHLNGIGGAAKPIRGIGTVIGALVGPLVAVRVAAMGVNTALLLIRGAGKALAAVGTVIKSITNVTKLWTLAQTALNVVMSPWFLIPAAIAAIGVGFYEAYKHIKPFRDAVNKVGQDIKKFFTGKLGWEKSVASEFSKLGKDFQKFAKKIPQFFKGVGKAIVKAIVIGLALPVGIAVTLMKPLIKPLQNSTKSLIKTVQKQWQSFSKWLGKLFDPVAKLWKRVWNGWARIFSIIWKSLRKIASSGMKAIERLISPAVKAIEKVWTTSWNAIARFFSGIWRAITSLGKSGMQLLQGAISGPLNTISNIWHSAWNSISNFFKGIWDGIKQAAQDGMNGVINVINAGISAINKVWSFFTGHGTGVKELGHVHFAQGGVVRRHLSVINDGDGPDWKELVQTPDGNLFMSQERNWTGFLPEGTRVYSGPETRQIMNAVGVSHYASGGIVGDVEEGIDWAKGSLDNLGSWMGDKIDAIMDFLDDPLKAVKGLLKKATDGMTDKLGHYGELATGALDKLTQPISDWFKKNLEPILDKLEEANPGGAGVARWRPFIKRAAKMEGIALTPTMMQKMLTQINTESGGNPGAIGGTDGLADGHATGLLQFKPGTFRSWIWHGHGNIMNGFDQILAAFNALQHGGEGGWGNFGIPGKGWATGGEITSQQFGWVGDNPQHHEFVLNPYAPSAEPLLDRAFEATADAQPSGQSGQAGNSKLDRMIELLEILVANVEGLDLNVSLDGEAIRRYNNKENAKEWQLRKG